ncbi:MAG: HlyD family efflux transporter periplasmic adaptor subunit [Bacteroidota bacterium]
MPEEFNNIEIRSEEIDDLLGKAPSSIVRWGITVIFSVISVIFVGSYFYKYPDIINAEISVQSENIPASIIAKNSGKITQLLVKDKQGVKNGDVLAVLENTANLNDVYAVKTQIQNLDSILKFQIDSSLTDTLLGNSFNLGDLQTGFSTLQKALKDYVFFLETDFPHKKIKSTESQISKHEALYQKMQRQTSITQEQLKLAKSQFMRDSMLYVKKVTSELDFEKSQTSYLQSKYSFESAKSSLDNAQISISQLQFSVLEMEQQYNNDCKQLRNGLISSLNTFQAQIKSWEQMYLLISPINGKVTFTQFWSENQNVKAGDNTMTIIPFKETKIVGRIKLPVQGSGKVKIGQRVNIKFNNYPYMEYGMVTGKIKNIALIPTESFYIVEVELLNGLQTNYKKKLPFNQEMQGVAEVVTDDVRLIERFFNPIKAILKNQAE